MDGWCIGAAASVGVLSVLGSVQVDHTLDLGGYNYPQIYLAQV